MTESVLEFGPARRLVGILTRPVGPSRDVAVLITNSGIIHRVGANRLHVRLARYLAKEGYTCLRYDLPGIGDSERLGVSTDIQQENIVATRAAFDALERSGVARRFVIIGLCSGADHSFRVSCADPRVAGAVLIDPTAMFSTPRHRLNLMLLPVRRGLRPRVLWRLFTRRYGIRQAIRANAAEQQRPGAPVSLQRPHHDAIWKQTRDAFASLIDRGVRVYMVITGHNKRVYSYPGQIFDAYPELEKLATVVRVAHLPLAEHTFSVEADRKVLERGVLDWLESVDGHADDTSDRRSARRSSGEGSHEHANA